MIKQQLRAYMVKVRSMYKRKDTKIRPATVPLPNGINPGGGELSRPQAPILGSMVVWCENFINPGLPPVPSFLPTLPLPAGPKP